MGTWTNHYLKLTSGGHPTGGRAPEGPGPPPDVRGRPPPQRRRKPGEGMAKNRMVQPTRCGELAQWSEAERFSRRAE